ncbi:RNA polymerase sigma factor [Thermodesulfobacteriota bacterium]
MPNIPNFPKKQDEDSELIAGINSGRKELYRDLIKRYEQKLYNFGLRMCGDIRDAEDLVQDTFLNVFRYLNDFRYETKFRNWLYRIATNVCIKKRRKSKFAPERELSLEEFLPDVEKSLPNEIPAWARTPSDQLLDEELSGTLKSTILSLPENYRLVVVLRDIEGFSTEETARILNLTPTNVKVRLHRARLFLKDKLKSYFENDERESYS